MLAVKAPVKAHQAWAAPLAGQARLVARVPGLWPQGLAGLWPELRLGSWPEVRLGWEAGLQVVLQLVQQHPPAQQRSSASQMPSTKKRRSCRGVGSCHEGPAELLGLRLSADHASCCSKPAVGSSYGGMLPAVHISRSALEQSERGAQTLSVDVTLQRVQWCWMPCAAPQQHP